MWNNARPKFNFLAIKLECLVQEKPLHIQLQCFIWSRIMNKIINVWNLRAKHKCPPHAGRTRWDHLDSSSEDQEKIKVSVHLTSELNQWTEQCACLKIGKGFILKGLSSLKCLFVFLLLVDLSAGKVACLHFFLSYIYALVWFSLQW